MATLEELEGFINKRIKPKDTPYDRIDDEAISAFAFETAREIEKLIDKRTRNLEFINKVLEAKILNWYLDNGRDEKFAEHFGISTSRQGEILKTK